MADLKKVLYDLTSAIVDSPDDIAISMSEENGEIKMLLSVAPDDMGKVIGRRGNIARAIRLVMKAAANKYGKKITVEIV